jgi:hypothetical protein
VDYFLLPLTTTIPTQLTPNAAKHKELPNPVSHHWETRNSSTFPRDKQQKQLARSGARAREQASKQDAGRCSSLSLCNKSEYAISTRSEETAGMDRGRRPRRQARNRAVTSLWFFFFVFFLSAQKTLFSFFLFLFFPLNKGKHNQAPYEYILGYDEFFEKNNNNK